MRDKMLYIYKNGSNLSDSNVGLMFFFILFFIQFSSNSTKKKFNPRFNHLSCVCVTQVIVKYDGIQILRKKNGSKRYHLK